MKALDKKIIKVILYLLLLVFGISLILDYSLTFKIIALIGALIYMVFICFHLAIFAPLIYICIRVNDKINTIHYVEKIENESVIIYNIIQFVSFFIVCFVLYIITPIILAMIFNHNINLSEAIELVIKIIS